MSGKGNAREIVIFSGNFSEKKCKKSAHFFDRFFFLSSIKGSLFLYYINMTEIFKSRDTAESVKTKTDDNLEQEL
jgi:hypothetical protein